MTIPEKLIKKWKVLKSPGDAGKLSDKLADSYPEMFNRALREGKCTDEVFAVMAPFYEEKEKMVKEYLL